MVLKLDAFIASRVAQLEQLLPEGSQAIHNEFKQAVSSILKEGLNRMNLMSREEFEVQTQVLAATQEKLTRLEQRLAELEQQVSVKPSSNTEVAP